MNDKAKYLITGFVVGAVTVWFFTFIAISSKNSNPNLQMTRGMGIYQNSDSFDAHFIEQMIPHHEDAVVMSELALERATRPEVRELAQNIITSQSGEIDQMKVWYEEWFGEAYKPDSFSSGGMQGMGYMGMMHGETDVRDLEEAEDFDREFVSQMIPHHQMAVMMANMLENSTTRPEMKKLAEDIITAQTSEIDLMRGWLENWE